MTGDTEDRARRFAERLEPCLRRLLAGVRLIVRDPGQSDDVLQNGLYEAFRTYDPALHDERFLARTWRCVAHAALRAQRTRRRLRFREQAFPGGDPDMVADLRAADSYEHVLADPGRCLEEVGDGLRRAVLALPDSERWTFLLRTFGDLRYREIAEILDVPLGSVMTWLHRARARLRAALAPDARREDRR